MGSPAREETTAELGEKYLASMRLSASKKGRSISDNLSKNTVSHRAARGSSLAGLFLRGGSQLHRETGEAEIVAGMFGPAVIKRAARLPWVVGTRIKSEQTLKREYTRAVCGLIKEAKREPTYWWTMAVQRAQTRISSRAFAAVRKMNLGLGHGLASLHGLANEKQNTKAREEIWQVAKDMLSIVNTGKSIRLDVRALVEMEVLRFAQTHQPEFQRRDRSTAEPRGDGWAAGRLLSRGARMLGNG
jgi:hypothetical protein